MVKLMRICDICRSEIPKHDSYYYMKKRFFREKFSICENCMNRLKDEMDNNRNNVIIPVIESKPVETPKRIVNKQTTVVQQQKPIVDNNTYSIYPDSRKYKTIIDALNSMDIKRVNKNTVIIIIYNYKDKINRKTLTYKMSTSNETLTRFSTKMESIEKPKNDIVMFNYDIIITNGKITSMLYNTFSKEKHTWDTNSIDNAPFTEEMHIDIKYNDK